MRVQNEKLPDLARDWGILGYVGLIETLYTRKGGHLNKSQFRILGPSGSPKREVLRKWMGFTNGPSESIHFSIHSRYSRFISSSWPNNQLVLLSLVTLIVVTVGYNAALVICSYVNQKFCASNLFNIDFSLTSCPLLTFSW